MPSSRRWVAWLLERPCSNKETDVRPVGLVRLTEGRRMPCSQVMGFTWLRPNTVVPRTRPQGDAQSPAGTMDYIWLRNRVVVKLEGGNGEGQLGHRCSTHSQKLQDCPLVHHHMPPCVCVRACVPVCAFCTLAEYLSCEILMDNG
jgi:hypothetical protein